MDAWVPLFQTLAWVGLAVFALVFSKTLLRRMGDAIVERISRGGGVEFSVGTLFSAKLGELRGLQHIDPGAERPPSAAGTSLPAWTTARSEATEATRRLHLVHVIS